MNKYNTYNPKRANFLSAKDYNDYRKQVVCLVCKKRLETGDEWRFQTLQTPEEAGSLNVIAGVVHRKCVETKEEEK